LSCVDKADLTWDDFKSWPQTRRYSYVFCLAEGETGHCYIYSIHRVAGGVRTRVSRRRHFAGTQIHSRLRKRPGHRKPSSPSPQQHPPVVVESRYACSRAPTSSGALPQPRSGPEPLTAAAFSDEGSMCCWVRSAAAHRLRCRSLQVRLQVSEARRPRHRRALRSALRC
jgi:hypothetical protein